MVPADAREVDLPGAFFKSQPPSNFKPSAFDHLPLHWSTHVMHALEVIAYRHPDPSVASDAYALYEKMVRSFHLPVESREQMITRLSEDRIANGTVSQ